MKAVRLRYPLREVAVSLWHRVVFFSSYSAVNTKSKNYLTGDCSNGSSMRKYLRKFQWKSANFIGTVEQPLEVRNGRDDTPGAWTFLRVKAAPESNSTFRVMLKLWGEMAESSLRSLKPNDCIYVAGSLEAYKKADKCGKSNLYYELTARELNCLSHDDRGSRSQDCEDIRHKGQARQENYMNRLHLWQVFFSNPNDWWDNRSRKLNPKQPDFKHKATPEALWLSASDPPWIRKQLELLDTKMAGKGKNDHFDSDSCISNWL